MNKKKIYKIVFISTLALCVFSFIWAWWVTRGVRNNSAETLASQKVAINNLVLTETKDKKKYWEIYGETGNYNNADKKASLDNILGNFYKENEVSMSFSAEHGVYDEVAKTITLTDKVFSETIVSVSFFNPTKFLKEFTSVNVNSYQPP